MNTYKSVWPAIAREDMKSGETIWATKWRMVHSTPVRKKNPPMLKY